MTVATVDATNENLILLAQSPIYMSASYTYDNSGGYVRLRKWGHMGHAYRGRRSSAIQGFLLTQEEFLGLLILPQDAYLDYLTAIKEERKNHDSIN